MTMAIDVDLAEVDLTDLDRWWADGPPHALFARMRAEAPVHWNASADGHGFWSLTRGSEIREVSTNPGTFSCARGGIFLRPDALGPLEFMRNLAIAKDPPEHTRFREIVSKVFRARNLVLIDEHIKHSIANALERIAERGSCDLVKDIAEPIPLRVIGRMIGAPDEDMGQLLAWTEEIEIGIAHSQDVSATFAKMATHLLGTVDNQVIRGVDSLASSLAGAEVDGQRLTADEIALYFGLLLYAGNGPTRNAISAGMLALMEHPEQLRLLQDDPSLITPATEEILRWATPVLHFRRTATRDHELRGQRIAVGDKVVTWYISANRDEEVFSDPYRFDVTRRPNDHVTFGPGGPHFCLGAHLARLETKILFQELLPRLRSIELAGPVERIRSNFVNGIKRMPVRVATA
jgi:cholest-4-en-3-one 26-monooxygenase